MHSEDWDIRRNMAHWGGEIHQFLGMNNRTEFPNKYMVVTNVESLRSSRILEKSYHTASFLS